MADSEPTMDFQAAWAALVEGKAVRRAGWTKDMLRVEITGDDFREPMMFFQRGEAVVDYPFAPRRGDWMGTDWMIADEESNA